MPQRSFEMLGWSGKACLMQTERMGKRLEKDAQKSSLGLLQAKSMEKVN